MPDSKLHKLAPSRLEAFSDGVIAILITIMILEIKPPHEATLVAWAPVIPTLLAYALSFAILAIYWNNHHHLLKATHHISPSVMWANMHLLFWLSLIPVATLWMGDNYTQTWPVVFYSFICLMAGPAYYVLTKMIIKTNPTSTIAKIIGKNDTKGIFSQLFYLASLGLAFVSPYISYLIIVLAALMWVIPDHRLIDDD